MEKREHQFYENAFCAGCGMSMEQVIEKNQRYCEGKPQDKKQDDEVQK